MALFGALCLFLFVCIFENACFCVSLFCIFSKYFHNLKSFIFVNLTAMLYCKAFKSNYTH